MENNQAPQVSPHKINNFVYEEDNRIILDFGTNDDFGKWRSTVTAPVQAANAKTEKAEKGIRIKFS